LLKKEVVVNNLMLTCLVGYLIACGTSGPAALADDRAASTTPSETEKTLARLSQLVGGTWVNDNPKFVVEFRYEWAFNHKAIRGLGVIDKGGAHESPGEAIMGTDPINKTVYYVDCHGGDAIYQGTVKLEGEDVVFEFATTVGRPAKWREVLRFADTDTMQFTIFGERQGKWVPVVKQTSRRKQPTTDASQLVTEGIVEAPVSAVWAALTTREGQESWNVAHAEIDLRIGGKMRTHYDPKGKIGDPNTIENTILSFEPNHVLSIQVANPPAKFPFKEAIKKVWTVIRFEELAPSRTRLTITGLGYGNDDESKKLRQFFDKGNAYTIKKLQEKFAARGAKAS
jgi:uncharacterized protein YndB with AHSA1/START domain